MSKTFEGISPADFFYRNRDLAGFTNPSRAIFSSIRELVENALDASELVRVPPEIYLRLSFESKERSDATVYKLRIQDNGSGIPPRHIPSAFGKVLYGSKFKLRQARGTFGLGGTMAILYGQITTHKPVYVVSSTGSSKIYKYKLMIDIQRNRPIVLDRKMQVNKDRWHGTVVEFFLEAEYSRAMSKIVEYLKQTALVNPYANIAFIDPEGRLFKFTRATTTLPPLPEEISPHPHGVDVETIQRLTRVTKCRNMVDFMRTHFHRVSEAAALRFLQSAGFIETKDPKKLRREEIAKLKQVIQKSKEIVPDPKTLNDLIKSTESRDMLDLMKTLLNDADENKLLRLLWFGGFVKTKDPRKLKPQEIVRLMRTMKRFEEFRPPNAGCLSPLGKELLETGILKELKPDFIAVRQRKPATYSGHPFIVETAIAYGGKVPRKNEIVLYRFANRIPLLYDEASDVSWKIIKTINWRRYKVTLDMPIAILVHICSTKIPYKTVGKEFIADRPEVRSEILNGIREVSRKLQRFLTKREHVEMERRRLNIFFKYLPKIARFSTELVGKEKLPDIEKLCKRHSVFNDCHTTDAYTDSETFNAQFYKTKLIHIYNKHATNAVKLKILGYTDSSEWGELKSETILDEESKLIEMQTEKCALIKIQVKSASPGNPGVVDAFIDGFGE